MSLKTKTAIFCYAVSAVIIIGGVFMVRKGLGL